MQIQSLLKKRYTELSVETLLLLKAADEKNYLSLCKSNSDKQAFDNVLIISSELVLSWKLYRAQ